MTRKHWITAGVLGTVACLLAVSVGGAWLVYNVPGVARLIRAEPASPTPPSTLRPTFTPLVPIATLTPGTTPTISATLSTAVVLPSLSPTAIRPTEELTALPKSPTVLPSSTSTAEPPTFTPAPPEPTARPQWIAFETKRGNLGDYEIFVVAPDGSRLGNLTQSWADDVAPVWSPDGRRIAFVSLRDTVLGKWGLGPSSIYRMDVDPSTGTGAGNVVRLTDDAGNDGWPTWAPDGQRVAFESDRSGNWDIWIVNMDGSDLTNLTRSADDDERFPAWSPDGTRMAFTSQRSGSFDVWVMNVQDAIQGGDGSPLNLTKTPDRNRYAMWSPDGGKIAFNTNRDGNQEIYVMNADGSNPTNVSQSPDSIEGLADWSPDGRRLVLYSDRPGNKDIFVLDLASGRWTNISNNPASDEFCSWSP